VPAAGEPGGGICVVMSRAGAPPGGRGSTDEVEAGRGVCAGGGRLWAHRLMGFAYGIERPRFISAPLSK